MIPMFSIRSRHFGKFFFYLFVLGFAGNAWAQPNNKFVTNSVTPAPNAGALGKYGDIPVNLFTGVPSISIPIHTVQEGPLSLPISLSYHASGIKVAEMASWVGLGWSLNAGGIITRTVQGIPDELVGGYYNTGFTLPDVFYDSLLAHRSLLDNAEAGGLDTEPDLFTFNVGGYSGKFYIDHKRAANEGRPAYTFIPKQDLKLEFNPSFTQFVIIGTDGVRYVFGTGSAPNGNVDAREHTLEFGQPGTKKYCSSWYLIKIESPDLKYSISLEYETEYYAYTNYAPCKRIEYWYLLCGSTQSGGNQNMCSSNVDPSHSKFVTEIDGKRLKRIVSSTDVVDFEAIVNRLDLDQHNSFPFDVKRLENIYIKSGVPQTVCKRFGFMYDYYKDTMSTQGSSLYQRLRLLELRETNCDATLVLPPHKFNYNGVFLPWRLSKAVDHWGYFNGAMQNDTQYIAVPPTTVTVANNQYTFGSANRETNESWMKRGMLTSIEYPTGGKTTFGFEANTAAVTTIVDKELLRFSSCATITQCCGTNAQTRDLPIPFASYSQIQNARFTLKLNPVPPNPPTSCSKATSFSCKIQAFRKSDSLPLGVGVGINTSSPITIERPLTDLEGAFHFEPDSLYYFVLESTDGKAEFILTLSEPVTQNRVIGGLRIKEIRHFDGISAANDIVRTYEYVRDNTAALSSGHLYKIPSYGFGIVGLAYPQPPTPGNAIYYQVIFQEQPFMPMFNFEGFHCGYERVKENLNGNGHKIHYFNYSPNPSPPLNYPLPPESPTVTLGHVRGEQIYDASGVKVASSSMDVLEASTETNSTSSINKMLIIPFSCPLDANTSIPMKAYRTTRYYISTAAARIMSRVDSLDGVRTETQNYYDPQDRFQMPVATHTVNSDNKVTTTEFKYVHDYQGSCAKDTLMKKNMIGTPWETIVKVNNQQVAGQKTEFAMFLDNGTSPDPFSCKTGIFPRPYKFYNYEMTWGNGGATPGYWDLAGTIEAYNTQGMPASFRAGNTAANWPVETYTWNSAGLILSRSYLGFTWGYQYHTGTRLVSRITDKDGQETWFDYDPLTRLSKGYARPSTPGDKNTANVKKEYTYQYRNGTTPNNVRTKTIYTPVAGSALSETEDIEYFDGLGRSIQQIGIKASPQLRDVITATIYDNQGRTIRQSTPFHAATTNGAYQPNFPHTIIPGTVTEYEASPLNRIKGVTPPGWYKTITGYGTNTTPITHPNGTQYPANSLMTTTVTDPNGNKGTTYKDKKGRTLLSRRSDATGAQTADTYSTYDDKDRLTTVYPPDATNNTPDLLFSYQYDESDNVISKKVPDKAGETMQYNARDLQMLYRDGNMAANGHWMMTQYDDYGRPTKTGFSTNMSTFSELLTETFYDAAGRVQQSKAKLLDQPSSNTWIVKSFFYDAYSRLVGAGGNSHIGNDGIGINAYDFADNVLQTTRQNTGPAGGVTIAERSDFDHRGRKKNAFHKVNNDPEEEMANFVYNHRNFLISKSLAKKPNNWSYNLSYSYNPQGWLTAIKSSCDSEAALELATGVSAEGLQVVASEGTMLSEDGQSRIPVHKIAVSGTIMLKNQTQQPFSLEIWHKAKNIGTDSLTLIQLSSSPDNFQLIGETHLNLQNKKVNYDALATFYEDLRYEFLQTKSDQAEEIDLAVQASLLQSAIEKALTPLSTLAAQEAQEAINANIITEVAPLVLVPLPITPFSLKINYDVAVPTLNAPAQKNGNITSIHYGCGDEHVYGFQYDFLDRMTKGTYASYSSFSGAYSNFNHYNEEIPNTETTAGYDKRGNIKRMKRNSRVANGVFVEIDNLQYGYGAGNQLAQIAELGGQGSNYWNMGFKTKSGTAGYGYDANGNMVSDGHKGISDIKYNHLNLPKRITFADGFWIEYLYDANGTKLRKTTLSGTVQHYVNGIEYSGNLLDAIYHAEGRCTKTFSGAFRYEYYLKDHLGSVRSIFTGYSTPLQENHYYPFGMMWENQTASNPYTFNGKELNRDNGLGWYDYGARWYDAAVGRWWSGDPMIDKYQRWSPYNYGMDNPIRFFDKDGMEPDNNILYILAVGTADMETVKSAIDANHLEKYISEAGLMTKVILVNDPSSFDITKMDKTDAVAVVGGTKSEAADFILGNIDKDYLSSTFQKDIGEGSPFRKDAAGENPETSDRGDQNWGYVIATSTQDNPRIESGAKNIATSAHKNFALKSLSELVGTTIIHGMGHLSGITHIGKGKGSDNGFMADGDNLARAIKATGGILPLIRETVQKYSNEVIKVMQERFNGQPNLNYDPNN